MLDSSLCFLCRNNPISMYPRLWEATGVSYTELVSTLVDLALEKHRQRAALKRDFDLR